MRGGINSCKNNRKEAPPPPVESVSDQKLRQFLEKRRMVEEKQRQKQLNLLKEQREEVSKKRERVLSACGVRQPYVCTIVYNSGDSPRIAVHNKKDSSAFDNQKSKDASDSKNLPPKVPRPPPSNQLNYKLPPKPTKQATKNISYDYNSNRLNSSRQKSIERLNTDRDRSKENLKRVGERAVQSRGSIGRSNSVQKVVYPSWWG